MTERVKISSIIQNQVPEYVKDEYPLAVEFLRQYYTSLEGQGNIYDILQNIDHYVDVDNLINYKTSTNVLVEVTYFDDVIFVNSTEGFPEKNGLIKINNEIIFYKTKTNNSFVNCIRGFSGITAYQAIDNPEELVFEQTSVEEHFSGDLVENLSANLLKEFFRKLKTLIAPGFEDKDLFTGINESLFLKQSGDFYRSKGTDASFKILFGALYGKKVQVIKPKDYLIEPSAAEYRITRDFVVESIQGDPLTLVNTTLYQDEGFLKKSNGTITNVERILRGDKTFYVISLDFEYNRDINVSGTIFGDFNIHPKTKTTTVTPIGASVLDVDSTVGFPDSGELVISLSDELEFIVTYTSKSINQFYGCSGIISEIPAASETPLNVWAYGFNANNEEVRLRITGVLSNLEIFSDTKYLDKDQTITINNLGYNKSDERLDNWYYNLSIIYNVKQIELIDALDFTYRITLYDNPALNVGDSVTIISNQEERLGQILTEQGSVISFDAKTSFIIGGQGELDTSLTYRIRKNILRPNLKNYSNTSIYHSNVQNAYFDLKDQSVYVAASSLPSYSLLQLDTKDGDIILNQVVSGDTFIVDNHHFYTGDSIVYASNDEENDSLSSGIYFVKRDSFTEFKLSRSRNDLDNQIYISINGQVNGKLSFFNFVDSDLTKKSLENQKLVRRIIKSPELSTKKTETIPGPIGIFNNGVEIFNYKSTDSIFYGPIESVIPTASGSGYDVINAPIITISDPVGSNAVIYPGLVGNLEEIQVIDPGFDYVDVPKIIISGGNGSGARAIANLVNFDHVVEFNASTGLDIINNIITTLDEHKFRDNEEVIYFAQGQSEIGGLVSGSSYFVGITSSNQLKLYPSFNDSASLTNPIDLTAVGTGNHSLRAVIKKKRLNNISIENKGINYRNKKNVISPVGVNTASNTLNLPQHDFVDKDIVCYQTTGSGISGLSTTSFYYVKKVDNDHIRLASISTIGSPEQNYNDNIFIDFSDQGSGEHIFNHQPIVVSVVGSVGVSSYSANSSLATIQPVFTGSIESIFVANEGSGYGSADILNYNRQPEFLINTGSTAQVKPVISNGQIIDVVVLNSGSNYNSPPKLIVNGSGSGAILTPVINSGLLEDVIVVSSGGGYIEGETTIDVVQRGSGAKFSAKIKQWRVNLVERLINSNLITEDDGVIVKPINEQFGIQYSHLYASRKLRESVLAKRLSDGKLFFKADILSDYTNLKYHSPIIGWAYDGNPIYGPYGYTSPEGGSIKALESGYELVLDQNRPPLSLYPLGFFVEDYQFKNVGDLDEHNGRFCITPEFPNGVYAYFCCINSSAIEDGGAFNGFRKPVFPYIVGDTYKSQPDNFNFVSSSNQDELDFNVKKWLRNTSYYNIISENSDYQFISNPNKIKQQLSKIKAVTNGRIESIDVVASGDNYSVTDKVIVENSDSNGRRTKASIVSIKGKPVSSVSVATTSIENIEVIPFGSSFIGISSLPHNLIEGDVVTITTNFEFNEVQPIGVTTNILSLTESVNPTTITGIVTYFSVAGNLDYPKLKENDLYEINDEQVKILNIDKPSSRIRVLRNQNLTVGLTTHQNGSQLKELSNKIQLNVGLNTNYSYNPNREFYFDPKDSVGLGTISGVGIGYTINFSDPGTGITSIVIPTRTIYIPAHNLQTGTELIYNSNGGSTVSISTNGIANISLTNGQSLYVARISNDLIGLSLEKVSLGSTGTFVGVANSESSILYFTGIGTGKYHSFKTNFSTNIVATLSKNLVTIATSEAHGLTSNDDVVVNVVPGITTSITVEYNDFNRRLIIEPKEFGASDVDVSNNTIRLINHKLKNNQKVVHTASTPSGGLANESIYYVIYVDKDTIKLSTQPIKIYENFSDVNITSASAGRVLPINPPIQLTKNNTIEFDVSSPTLSFTENEVSYPAFDLVFYTDQNLTNRFESSATQASFEVTRTGRMGVDDNATVTLVLNDNVPNVLYYNLVPVDVTRNSNIKTEIIIDDLVESYNKISIGQSKYNGNFKVRTTTNSTFSYNLVDLPESSFYNSTSAAVSYTTKSTSAKGGIDKLRINSNNVGYNKLPSISIASTTGSGAILFANSSTIGSIQKIEIEDIGFNYSNDLTLRPTSSLPTVLKVEPLTTFKSIGITSAGRNYTIAPSLVVIDSFTNKVVDDVDLRYSLGDSKVTILKNTKGFYNSKPIIIPTNNTNGIPIRNVAFNIVNNDVIVTLASSFSDPQTFPFAVGDKVIIENVVTLDAGSKGYNSRNYNYKLFELTNIDSNISGIAVTVAYNLTGDLVGTETPGVYDSINSYGRIIPEKDFPIFDVSLQKGSFYVGETVYSEDSEGMVENWDSTNEYLKISSNNRFNVGKLITGKSSSSSGIINDVLYTDSVYNIEPSSVVVKGWKTETGFLNNTLQRIADNDYYQYFSYSLKSEIDYNQWNETVYNLDHTAGFKRFGDLVINSQVDGFTGISTIQNGGSVEITTDLYSVVSTNCYYDFDLVSENNITLDDTIKSNEINFNSRILQNYVESIGNRVLVIDDISGEFNSAPRIDAFSVIEIDRLNSYRSKKYITLVEDTRFTGEKQVCLVTLIHNDSFGYMSQYASVDTAGDLGSFDFSIVGDETYFEFYPIKNEVNNYNINYSYYSIEDTLTGIGTTSLGDVVKIESQIKSFPVGLGTTLAIVGIASTHIAAKVLVQISATNGSFYEYNELTVTNNGTDVAFIDYSQILTNTNSNFSSSGIGSYGASISGSGMNITLTPSNSLTTSINVSSIIVSIANTSYSGIGTVTFDNSAIASSEKNIESSPSPGVTTIATYSVDTYSGAYFIVSVKDITNNQAQISEVVTCNSTNDVKWTEYGFVETQSSLGIITAGISTESTVNLFFTPNPNIETKVVVYEHTIGPLNITTEDSIIDLENANIENGNGEYRGTLTAIKRDFNLTHQGREIFKRTFNPQLVGIVNTSTDSIRIPEHFFVTGEKITYTSDPLGSPIGIASTFVVGVGTTSLLPSTLYIVKLNDLEVKVSVSASDALLSTPKTLDIISVGVGTQHTFTSTQQNSKVLITLDNIIQSPVVSTGNTAILQSNLPISDSVVKVNDAFGLNGGDLIQIDNEIMRINVVGFGSTGYLLVDRPWFGTGIATHSTGALVSQITGNYNILDNTISFAEAPYGPTPQEVINGSDLNSIDFTGIQTSMTFSGRVFIRSGVPNSVNDTYSTNYIFNDISSDFTGITSIFTLKQGSSDLTGISTDNAIVLYNSILQTPKRDSLEPIGGNYEIIESGGISSIKFSGYAANSSYDVNEGTLPRGGIIISVGSSQGFGYQPLVAAGGTAVVSIAGTISSVSIGNTGSGYRGKKDFIIETKTLGITTAGFTTIFIGNQNSVFGILNVSNTGSNCKVSIGTYIQEATIDTINNNNIVIAGVSVTTAAIPADEVVNVRITNPAVGTINVGVANSSTGINTVTHIGYAQINAGRINSVTITNPGIGYTTSNPPKLVFETPLSYSNLPVVYSSSSPSGIGSGAKLDIIVGQGSSIINFDFTNLGYAYNVNDILTIETGGVFGVPLNSSIIFDEFRITVDGVYDDKFTGWVVGSIQTLDPIDDLFDGIRTVFPISIDGERFTIRAKPGSGLDVQSTLIITVNDVVQVPGEGYVFTGGSTIRFTEPPKVGDKSTLMFYRGTSGVDVEAVDILETLKIGDNITINSTDLFFNQEERVVTDILATDVISTNVYPGPGISQNSELLRPVTVCQQINDLFIDGAIVTKDREIYDYQASPSIRLLKNLTSSSTEIFIDNARPYLSSDPNQENTISIFSNETWVAAAATAVVSTAGTVSSIVISNGGVGYTTAPQVSLSSPIGFGTTLAAQAIASITSGIVTTISITSPGSFYTTTNPPQVLIGAPEVKKLTVKSASYDGDFGVITGIGSTSIVGVASTGLVMDFHIPLNSYLRNPSIVGTAITISGIQTGYYFVIDNSNVGNASTSYDENNDPVGFGSTYLDNVYRVARVSVASSTIIGVGATFVARVIVSVSDNTLSGITTNFYGNFSWGRVYGFNEVIPGEFYSYFN